MDQRSRRTRLWTAPRWKIALTILCAPALLLTHAPGASAGDKERGFYIRASLLSLDRGMKTSFFDKDCSTLTPTPLYSSGCSPALNGEVAQGRGETDPGSLYGFGLGYRLADPFRVEITAEHRANLGFSGTLNYLGVNGAQTLHTKATTRSAFLMGYADLPGLARVTPFLGAGIGATRVTTGTTHMIFPRTRTTIPGATTTNVSWRIAAGVAVAVTERLTLDLMVHHTDLGEMVTGVGGGRVSGNPNDLGQAATVADLVNEGLRISLRYNF